MLWIALLVACSTPGPTPSVAPEISTQPLALGPISVAVPSDWSVQAQVARVPASPSRCTVQRLPPNAAKNYANVKASAERIGAVPPEGVVVEWKESPVGDYEGVEVLLKNTKMKGDWRSIQRMIVVEEGCIAVVQCSGNPWTEQEAAFRAVLDSVKLDPTKCELPTAGAPQP